MFEPSPGGGSAQGAGEAVAAGQAPAPEQTLERVQAAATEYYEKLAETAAQLTEQAQKVYESSQAYVRTHPGPVVGSAFLVGLLLGLVSGRD